MTRPNSLFPIAFSAMVATVVSVVDTCAQTTLLGKGTNDMFLPAFWLQNTNADRLITGINGQGSLVLATQLIPWESNPYITNGVFLERLNGIGTNLTLYAPSVGIGDGTSGTRALISWSDQLGTVQYELPSYASSGFLYQEEITSTNASMSWMATIPVNLGGTGTTTTNAALRALGSPQQLTSYASLAALNPDTGAHVVTVAFAGAPDLTYRAEASDPGYGRPLVATNSTSGKFWVARPNAVDPRWWGAVADDALDDSPAFNAMFATNPDNVFVPPGVYLLESAVVATNIPNVTCAADAILKVSGAGEGTFAAITFGVDSADLQQHRAIKNLRVECATPSIGWASTNHIGIRLINCGNVLLEKPYVYGYTTGIQLKGASAQTVAGNIISAPRVYNCQRAVEFRSDGGYVNSNTLNGGYVSILNGPAWNNADVSGWVIDSNVGYLSNGNVWYNPTFELNATTVVSNGYLPRAFDVRYGVYNAIENGRAEDASTTGNNSFTSTTTSAGNKANWGVSIPVNAFSGPQSHGVWGVFDSSQVYPTARDIPFFTATNILDVAYTASGGVGIVGGVVPYYTNPAILSVNPALKVTDYGIEFNGNNCLVGVYVDTSTIKRWRVQLNASPVSTTSGSAPKCRVVIKPYDITPALLGSSGVFHVRGNPALLWNGYGYDPGSANDFEHALEFSTQTKFAFIGGWIPVNAALRGIRVSALPDPSGIIASPPMSASTASSAGSGVTGALLFSGKTVTLPNLSAATPSSALINSAKDTAGQVHLRATSSSGRRGFLTEGSTVTTKRTSLDDSTDVVAGDVGSMNTAGWPTVTGWTNLTGSWTYGGGASGTLASSATTALAVPGRTVTVTVTFSGTRAVNSGAALAFTIAGNLIKTFGSDPGATEVFSGQMGTSTGNISIVGTKNAGNLDVTIDAITITVHAAGDWLHQHAYTASMLVQSASTGPYVDISASGTFAANGNAKDLIIGLSDTTVSTVPVPIVTLPNSFNGKDWILTGRLSASSPLANATKLAFFGKLEAAGETVVIDTATDQATVGGFAWNTAGYIYIGANADGADADVTINESSVIPR